MRTLIRISGRLMEPATMLLALWYLCRLQSVEMVDGVVAAARQQRRPRGWPWQKKTVRDYADVYRSQLAELATLQGAALLQVVQQQSRPRRWPWQKKTIRDLIDARSAEVVVAAAEWSADLAAEVAKRKDALVATAKQQSRPRRWPWQKKTIRDRVSERSAELATMAAERGAQLAALAAKQRNALLQEARRQSRPRRWPWQQKTVRDYVDERGARVGRQVGRIREQVQQQAVAVVPTVQDAVSGTAERLKGLAEQSREAVPSAIEAAAQRPVQALTSSVQAGQRTVRWGVRLLRTALWAALIGTAVGLLLAPTSGAELRRRLRAIVDQVVQMLEPQSSSS
jgi:gas vesicle protein